MPFPSIFMLLLLHFFQKMDHSRPLFLYFRLFKTVDSQQINVRYKCLPMTGFEPQTSGVGSDRSTKWSTNNHRPKSLVTLLPNWLTNWFEPADVIWDVEFWFGRLKNCFSAHNKSSKWNKKCRPVTWRRAKDKTSFWRKQCNGGGRSKATQS